MRDHKVWEAFGYSGDDCRRLERIAQALVREGATDDITVARRAIAAITWRPLAEQMHRRNHPTQGHLEATLHALDQEHDGQVPRLVDYNGVKVTPEDAQRLADDGLLFGNAFVLRAADGTGRRIDPTTVRIDSLEGTLYNEGGEEVEALQSDADAPHGRCACGRPLDKDGEHPGGYGAWCGEALQLDAECQDERLEVELPVRRPRSLTPEVDHAHSASEAYRMTHGVRPDTLAIADDTTAEARKIGELLGIRLIVDKAVTPGILELRHDDRPRAYLDLETGWFKIDEQHRHTAADLERLKRAAPHVPRLDCGLEQLEGEGASQSPGAAGYTCALSDRAKSRNPADFRRGLEKLVRSATDEDLELLVGAWFAVATLALWLDGYRWWTAPIGGAVAAIALAAALLLARHVLASSTRDASLDDEDGPTTRGNG